MGANDVTRPGEPSMGNTHIRAGRGFVLLVLAGAALRVATAVQAQPADVPPEGRIIRLDSALDAIVASDARIEKAAGGFGFTEGPVWLRKGALAFSDVEGNAILELGADGGVTVLRRPSGYTGPPRPPGSRMGSNGLTLDREGRLLICEQGDRRVTRLEADGTVTVLAERYDGKRLNSPNDIVVKSDGSIYFTDPPYGLATQRDDDPEKELPFNGIYRIVDGRVELLNAELTRPNGLAFSPDERYLYVANSDVAHRVWMRYPVEADGRLGSGEVFYDVTAHALAGIPDGFKVDAAGNLYGTGAGGVWIISPDGVALGRIEVPELPANVGFGEDGRTLFITARSSVYRVRLAAMGRLP